MRRGLTLAVGVALASTLGMSGTGAAPAQAATPINWNWAAGFVPNLSNSATPPPGAENVSDGHRSTCNWKASPTGRPLILVHGTWEHQRDNFMALSPFFKNAGMCVYTFNYGGNKGDVFWGYKSIAANAGEMSTYVDQVLASTGASQVDLVGHSQGGMMPRYYIKYLGGMPEVHTFVGLASGNNGTTLSGLVDLGRTLGVLPAISSLNPAATDQTIDSPFMQIVNKCPTGTFNVCAGDTVKYTVLQTNGDQIDTPYQNSFLTVEPGGPAVHNILVNDRCPLELSEHLGMTYSRNVAQLALKALDPTVKKDVCVLSLPYLGG